MGWHNPQVSQVRWLDALNTTNEEIPGHGVVYLNSCGYASEYGIEIPTDPYVLEAVKFTEWDATVPYLSKVLGLYGLSCEALEWYHDVMGLFAVNGPVPIPPGRVGAVTMDPPFVALCDLRGGTYPLVPKAGSWNLVIPKISDERCAPPTTWFEWFRILRDMEPGAAAISPIRPAFVDIDSLKPHPVFRP